MLIPSQFSHRHGRRPKNKPNYCRIRKKGVCLCVIPPSWQRSARVRVLGQAAIRRGGRWPLRAVPSPRVRGSALSRQTAAVHIGSGSTPIRPTILWATGLAGHSCPPVDACSSALLPAGFAGSVQSPVLSVPCLAGPLETQGFQACVQTPKHGFCYQPQCRTVPARRESNMTKLSWL